MVSLDSSFWSGRRVLLTGHTGFKGSWLALWLVSLGADVSGLSLEPDSHQTLFENLELVNKLDHRLGDIRDLNLVRQTVSEVQPEVVFHLAAQPLVRSSYLDPLQTWSTNVMGSVNLMESLRSIDHTCSVVMVTTDKVYQNNEWIYGYRENDPLGGHDPYSSSKAAAEIAISSWRNSFCGHALHQNPHLRIASARAGNVIGGGDWSLDRIVPDAIRALANGSPICVRNPHSTRPWQHVLEPLGGYLRLAEALFLSSEYASAFNFGPTLDSNRPVKDLVKEMLISWPGHWEDVSDANNLHEAGRLNLVLDLAYHSLGWQPVWDFSLTVSKTVNWYRQVHFNQASALECCLADLDSFVNSCS